MNKFFSHIPTDVSSIALGQRLVQYIQANKLLVDASVPILILQICWYWQKSGGKEDIPQRWSHLYDNIFNMMYDNLSSDLKRRVSKVMIALLM